MSRADLRALVQAMRLPFVVLAPVSVLLGASVAVAEGAAWHGVDLLLALLGGVLAHISVNALNEYEDFHSGLDQQTRRTPFSGGSGALVERPQAAGLVLAAAVLTMALTLLIGLHFVLRLGAGLVPLGLAGLLLIVTYTRWLNRWPLACLLAPGLAFGPLMVLGTHFVLAGQYSAQALLVSLVPFFLANNLLLLNQFPDIEADAAVGRRHFPIAYGVRSSMVVYAAFALGAALIVVGGAATARLPLLSVMALLPLAATAVAAAGAWRFGDSVDRLVPALGLNVAAAVLTPAVLALTLAI